MVVMRMEHGGIVRRHHEHGRGGIEVDLVMGV